MIAFKRTMIVGAALLLAACGGGDEYPVPATEAASILAGLGYSPAISPMPAAMQDVKVEFQSLPGGQSVQWAFTRDGADLGQIVATVEPNGEASTRARVDFVEGSGGNAETRAQLKGHIRNLLIEAVDSALDRRPFDMAVRADIEASLGATSAMSNNPVHQTFQGVDQSLKAHIKREKEREFENDYRRHANGGAVPRGDAVTQPTTDLSRFNN